MTRRLVVLVAGVACLLAAVGAGAALLGPYWSADELKRIQSLSLASLPALRPDPSNRVSDDPAAAALGKALFFDTRLSANGAISCASCHKPDRQFQDDLPVGHGMAEGTRRTMPIAGSAYFPFLFWDGRKDSQWSQALGPLENPLEHGADRTMVVRLVAQAYGPQYEALFGPAPSLAGLPEHAMPGGTGPLAAAWNAMSADQQQAIDRAYSNIGKSIAAFERTIEPQPTRFDAYAAALAAGDEQRAESLLTEAERNGLKLFIGKANCVSCHNGPLFTDNAFHNLGLPGTTPASDSGRSSAVATLKADPFNCLGPFSDAKPEACAELKFMDTKSAQLAGAFRSPSLRGVGQRAPFTHAGQFATLHAVLAHYNAAPPAPFGRSELKPLGLTDKELADIEAFLRTLDAR
ncbi:MAG TPA: cytochrome c peroxidase [Devosia sp.]|nr:cytochrome c peroxidase [Devosia sp.]